MPGFTPKHEVPIVLCIECPICGAPFGHVCQEFSKNLIAHGQRVAAAQTLFDAMAVRLRAHHRLMMERGGS